MREKAGLQISAMPDEGSLADDIRHVGLLSDSDLDDLHYRWEVHWAERIHASRKGSAERRRLFDEAYEGLLIILGEMRRRQGRELESFGFNADSVDRICEFLPAPPARFLDIGCGTGVLVEAMIGRGHDACGIDLSAACISTGIKRLQARFGVERGTAIGRGDFMEAEFGPVQFDGVYCNDVLEHIHPDEAGVFVRKAYGLLKPGGAFMVVTPNRWSGPGDATMLKHRRGTVAKGLHLREYTLSELTSMLRGAGFVHCQARLHGGVKGLQGTRARPLYLTAKLLLEPVFACALAAWPELRARIIWAMSYAEIVGFKAPA
jgi:2-polyprenyl-3-methyl-5-hydroxy-6-metoxy-1,4-benzoquinol methylase